LSFFSQARAFIVTGKGGVGKTTLSGVMANLAALQGLRVLVVELGTPGERPDAAVAPLARLFGRAGALDYEELVLRSGPGPGEVRARSLRPDTALAEYLHGHGMRRLSRRLVNSGALDIVATAVPGMPDMLVLGKLKQIERAAAAGRPGAPDVVVMDAPAAGHAVRFLQSPYGLVDAAGGGPVRAQAEEVVEMLSDPARCQVVLVTSPDETPVNETIETARLLEQRAGTKLCAVVVNARLPTLPLPPAMGATELCQLASQSGAQLTREEAEDLSAAGRLRLRRQESEAAQVDRLSSELPVPQLELPFCFSTDLGPDQLGMLTDALDHGLAGWAPLGWAPVGP
jgi:anion-transporting  ArsA/GET3 family ATPase